MPAIHHLRRREPQLGNIRAGHTSRASGPARRSPGTLLVLAANSAMGQDRAPAARNPWLLVTRYRCVDVTYDLDARCPCGQAVTDMPTWS